MSTATHVTTTTAATTTTAPTGAAADVLDATAEPAALTVSVVRGPEGTRLDLAGELEATTAPLLDCLVTDALEHEPGAVVLDLTRAAFCDVRGLDCLLTARRRAIARGRRLGVRGATPLLRRLLSVSGAADVIAPEG